jgi:hypothetical protein
MEANYGRKWKTMIIPFIKKYWKILMNIGAPTCVTVFAVLALILIVPKPDHVSSSKLAAVTPSKIITPTISKDQTPQVGIVTIQHVTTYADGADGILPGQKSRYISVEHNAKKESRVSPTD